MDDADVAELADLRRRAYGPDADIDTDPAAVARLDELETRARLRFAARSAPGESDLEPERRVELTHSLTGAPIPAVGETTVTTVVTDPAHAAGPAGPAMERPPRRGRRIALIAGVAAVAVLAVVQATGGSNAPQPAESPLAASEVKPVAMPASDSSETRLVDIPLDRSLARYVPQTPR
ncbi:MAG: hypothetical protein ACXWZG_00360, partial [Microbacterium sp.]